MESRKELNSIIDGLDAIAKVGKIFNKERRRVAKACFLQHYKQKAAARGLTAVTGRHKVTRKSVGPQGASPFLFEPKQRIGKTRKDLLANRAREIRVPVRESELFVS